MRLSATLGAAVGLITIAGSSLLWFRVILLGASGIESIAALSTNPVSIDNIFLSIILGFFVGLADYAAFRDRNPAMTPISNATLIRELKQLMESCKRINFLLENLPNLQGRDFDDLPKVLQRAFTFASGATYDLVRIELSSLPITDIEEKVSVENLD